MIKIIILSAALFVGSYALASDAQYETQLFKLSKSLRGTPPSTADRAALRKASQEGRAESYLKELAKSYVSDPHFYDKMKSLVDELVRVKVDVAQYDQQNYAYDNLVRSIISKNLSWDQLLTAKSYQTLSSNDAFGPDEPLFYSLLDPTFKSKDDILEETKERVSYSFEFPAEDQRLAGIVTTQRFMNRYVTTALNKNRRRAAAVYRIFLCDSMIPTAPAADSKSQMMDYDVLLPHKNLKEEDIRRSFSGNIHGQQADCMSCHYKLDPLGQVFAFSAATLGVKASPGALRYKTKDLKQVNIPLRGFGDLGDQITQQKEYEKCQVSHFWRWFIGKDIPLTGEKEAEVITAFNKVGRKPKDFVTYLVSRPEFKAKPQILTEEQVLAHRVTTIFKSCNSCHDSQGAYVWDLSALPYGEDQKARNEAIDTLIKVLDINHDGENAEMPPSDSLWQLSENEFATIKKWIEAGAPDFTGKPQVKNGGRP